MKIKVTGCIALLIAVFAAGRYSVQSPTIQEKTEVKTNEIVQQNTHETIVRVREPGGKTTTTVTVDRATHTDEKQAISAQTEIKPKGSKVNLSLLVGADYHLTPVYGVSLSKELIGPVTIGVYGLTSGVLGLSIGVNF